MQESPIVCCLSLSYIRRGAKVEIGGQECGCGMHCLGRSNLMQFRATWESGEKISEHLLVSAPPSFIIAFYFKIKGHIITGNILILRKRPKQM